MSEKHAQNQVPVSELRLERLRRGELDPATAAALSAQLDADPALAARLRALEADDAAVLARYPPAMVASRVGARLAADQRRARRTWAAGLGTLALAAGAALVLLPPPTAGRTAGLGAELGVEDTVAKGATGAHLIVFRKAADEAVRLSDGAEAAEGDVLGLAYQSAKAAYGVIFSIDGRGTVTLHHPSPPEASSALSAGGVINLDKGYQLDDAPGFERFVLVTATHPIDVQQVISAAESLSPGRASSATIPLPPDLSQASLTLKKPR